MQRITLAATALALAGSSTAQLVGSAGVLNKCSYPVYLANTPSVGEAITQTLQPGDSYSQVYTILSNLGGWSIKLSKSGDWTDGIQQFEYTWQGFDSGYPFLWFDDSNINGDPWNGDWAFEATGDCHPRSSGYSYPSDNAETQSCPIASSVTIVLCTSPDGGSGSASSAVSAPTSSSVASVAAPSTTSTPETSAAPVPSTTSTTSTEESSSYTQPAFTGFTGFPFYDGSNNIDENGDKKTTPTTLRTVTKDRGGVTVTDIATKVVTNFVTATAEAQKRNEHVHEHVARHAHHHH